MEDIDQELKRVQLLRERLALEKELEQRVLRANTIGLASGAISGLSTAVRAAATGVVGLVARWWKVAATGAVVTAAVTGGVMWWQEAEQARRDAAEAQGRSEVAEFVYLRCVPEECRDASPRTFESPLCSQALLDRRSCEMEAQQAFHKLEQEKEISTSASRGADASAVGATAIAADSEAPPAQLSVPQLVLDGPPALTGTTRFVVQVGAFSDTNAARDALARVEKLGLKAYTQLVETSGGRRFRVRVGPYGTQEDASNAAAAIRAAGLSSAVLSL